MHASSHGSLVLCLLPLAALSLSSAVSGGVQKGEWTLSQSALPDHVQFSLRSSDNDTNTYSSSSTWPIGELRGLTWSIQTKHDVHFTIQRDAGSIDCEGFVRDGAGAGLFTFQPNIRYASAMTSLGFEGITPERLFAFTLHDISLDFARQIKAASIPNVDSDKLLAFRIHGVSPDYVQAIRAAGVQNIDADKLIAFRIHGVSPEFVKSLQGTGIEMRDPEKLIAFRIHGVSPEFVSDLARLGYARPDPDKLIALRIHGITPQYIQALRSRGLQSLTLDQLISLRIQGIE